MIVSIEWLHDYLRLPAELPAATLAHDLTMSTVEVEGVSDAGEALRGVVVGEVVAVAPDPAAPGRSVVECRVGEGRIVPARWGESLAGLSRVAVALPGAGAVRDAGGEQGMGMICAPEQLGLEGLFASGRPIDLSAFDAPAGTALSRVIGFDDVLLEIDNKSLTNRPDLWGHYGIARELAAIYQLPLEGLPGSALPRAPIGMPVEIDDPERCRRYTATRIAGVAAGEAPFWLRSRLKRVGQRPVNLLVDLTNYVMLATGQPSHAFDAAELRGSIRVRRALPDETIHLLDDRIVRPEDRVGDATLVIADDAGPLALAGVMGGKRGSIVPDTREMVLEMANFEPIGVRRTAAAVGARTDSSTRFEKGLTPLQIDPALGLFLHLLRQALPGAEVVGHTDVFPRRPEPVGVRVPLAFIDKKLGSPLPEEVVSGILRRLGFGVRVEDQVLAIEVPAWRATGDVSIPEDIVEEVGRLYGYEKLAFVAPRVRLTRAVVRPRNRMERRLKEYFASRGGMREVVTYPWVDDLYLTAAGLDDVPMAALHTPPAPSRRRLRPSLIPGLIEVVADNARLVQTFGVFESGRVFQPERDLTEAEASEHLPRQPKRVAGALVGPDASALFFRAKGLLADLAREVQVEPLTFSDAADARWAEPRGCLSILSDGRPVGVVGVLAPRALRIARIRGPQTVMFELDMDGLTPLSSRTNRYAPLSAFPEVEYDLSVLVDSSTRWERVRSLISGASELIGPVEFLEEYHGEQVPAGKKSLTVRLRLGAMDRTLTAQEIEAAVAAATDRLETEVRAEIRRR